MENSTDKQGLRIASIFIILVRSVERGTRGTAADGWIRSRRCLGRCCRLCSRRRHLCRGQFSSPSLSSVDASLADERNRFAKFFGSGVIIATAFMQ